jgi:hypothetical protein
MYTLVAAVEIQIGFALESNLTKGSPSYWNHSRFVRAQGAGSAKGEHVDRSIDAHLYL